MAGTVSPDMMKEFLASGSINPRDKNFADSIASGVVTADPELTQVVTAAAVVYCVKHFEEFRKESGLNKAEGAMVRLVMSSAALLAANGAHAMRKIREAFSE